ncbi:major facilitator superfamily transporter [Weissella oryzae SG25]|uniref:Major facilitator superfamily transporter n=1 Tax=Weissella oryzae (strain DSM 25784 / JCM 18191 / LMG 30913 / SG25) TaxID=1329250 RepID=A0A069CUI8_WEIOS|nr:MDR family MFS transporter [Weissella oryzae]GAK31149.1 major facilitator superfamily transporter [Weissella oryzae SG25]
MHTTETKAMPKGRSNLFWVIMPLSLVLFISTLDQTVTTTALTGIVKDLGHLSQASWVITIFMLTSAVMTLIFGKLGDIFGRKIILQIALAIFLLGSLLSGMATSMTFLILARGLQGIGAGGLNALVQAASADVIPARSRGKYQAIFGLLSMIALLVGPIIGGYFVAHISWQWLFFINLPIGIVASILIAWRLKLPVRKQQVRIDYLGAIFVTVATTAALLLVTLRGNNFAWTSWQSMTLIVTSLVSLALYLVVEHFMRHDALTPLALFKNTTFNLAWLMFALATAALFVAMVYVPMYVQLVHQVNALHAGYYMIPLLIALVLASIISGILVERSGKYKLQIIIAAVLIAVGFYGLSTLGMHSADWLIASWQLPAGFGIGIFVNIALMIGQNTVSIKDLGSATGVLNFFKTLGGAFGSALFGALLTKLIVNNSMLFAF